MNAKAFIIPAIFRAIDDFSRPIRNMQRNVGNFERSMRKTNMITNDLYRGLGGNYGMTGLSIGLYGVASGFKEIVKQAATAEQTIAAFTPMLGSAEKAGELFKMLQKTAATTPFEFGDLSRATNWLLPLTKGNLPETIKLLRMLGDTAGGNPEALNEIARNYSQILGKGKADMVDIKQFATYGIQVWDNMSRSTGKSVKELQIMQGKGQITGDIITKMFVDMTSAGGNYHNAMDIANKTLIGQWSNLKDNIKMAAVEIGLTFLPQLKMYVREAIGISASVKEWVIQNKALIGVKIRKWLDTIIGSVRWAIRNFETITTVLKYWAIALVATKAIIMATTLVTNGYRFSMFLLDGSIKAAILTQRLFGLSSLASMGLIGGIIAVLGLAAAAWYEFGNSMTEAQKAQKRMSENTISQELEVGQLFKTLRQTAETSQDYKNALARIIEINPDIVDAYQLQRKNVDFIIAAEKELIGLIRQRGMLQANQELSMEAKKRGLEINAGSPNWKDHLNSMWDNTVKFGFGSNADFYKNQRAQAEFSQGDIYDKNYNAEKILLDKNRSQTDSIRIEVTSKDPGLSFSSPDKRVSFKDSVVPKVGLANGW